jgi:hypothetical protein
MPADALCLVIFAAISVAMAQNAQWNYIFMVSCAVPIMVMILVAQIIPFVTAIGAREVLRAGNLMESDQGHYPTPRLLRIAIALQ